MSTLHKKYGVILLIGKLEHLTRHCTSLKCRWVKTPNRGNKCP